MTTNKPSIETLLNRALHIAVSILNIASDIDTIQKCVTTISMIQHQLSLEAHDTELKKELDRLNFKLRNMQHDVDALKEELAEMSAQQ